MDIYATCHLGYRGCVDGSGEDDLGNLFVSSFPNKDKNPLTHRKSSNYDENQYVWTGTPEYSDISKVEVPKLSAGKRRTDLGHGGGKGNSIMLTTYGRLGKKGTTGIKTGESQTKPNSGV